MLLKTKSSVDDGVATIKASGEIDLACFDPLNDTVKPSGGEFLLRNFGEGLSSSSNYTSSITQTRTGEVDHSDGTVDPINLTEAVSGPIPLPIQSGFDYDASGPLGGYTLSRADGPWTSSTSSDWSSSRKTCCEEMTSFR